MSRSYTPWSDDELGHLEDLRHLTAAQAAKVLGRTRKQVLHMRQRIRLGWVRQLEAVTDDDLDFVAAYPHFTAEEIGRHIGRTTASINQMRKRLRDEGAIGCAPSMKSPWHVAGRTLIAKTCTRCGLLLDASWFTSRGTKRPGHYASACRKCGASEVHRRNKGTRHAQKFAEKLQAITLETATNSRKEWTNSEMDILTDLSKTNFEKALILGRTYFGVSSRIGHMGLRSRKEPLPDPTNAQWYIHLRPEMAALFTEKEAA